MRGLFVFLLTAVLCSAQPTLSESDQTGIQTAVHNLVKALNDRDWPAVEAATTPKFDAMFPGDLITRNRLKAAFTTPDPQYRRLELATLVRLVRLLTPDVAVGDGYFRSINLPGGDSAGRVSLTLVRQDSKWLIATARFAPYHFDNERLFPAAPATTHTPAGPDGWITLFDGTSTDAFLSTTSGPFPSSWTVEDGALKAVPKQPGSQGLRTRDTYASFELRFEWKVPPKGNSGVKYRMFYLTRADGTGHEYQVVDDAGDPGAIQYPVERAGALYNQIAPSKAAARPVGEFNQSVIIVRGRHCEHWLNGEKVVEYEVESGPLEGPLLFQHHGTAAWFRNIRIKRLDAPSN